jgi:hypothetical protein
MSEMIRARLFLARMSDDSEPCICAAIDELIWENWDDEAEAEWIAAAKQTWGIQQDTEFKTVVAEFAPQDLVDAFETPTVTGKVGQ